MKARMVAMALTSLLLFTSCGPSTQSPMVEEFQAPDVDISLVASVGRSRVIHKFCDGPHLVYYFSGFRAGGLAVVEDGCR